MEIERVYAANKAEPHSNPSEELLALTNAAVSAITASDASAAHHSLADISDAPYRLQPVAVDSFSAVFSPTQPHRSQQQQKQQHFDSSVLSRRSGGPGDRSIDQSTFLHGNAQKVKVSVKKLREIQSPFDAHVQSSYDSMLRDSGGDVRSSARDSVVTHGDSPDRYGIVEPFDVSASPMKRQVTIEKHTGTTPTPSARDHPSGGESLGVATGGEHYKHVNTLTATVSDSGFASQHVRVVREKTTNDDDHLKTLNSTAGEMPSLAEEFQTTQERVVTAQHHAGKYCAIL